MLSDQMGADGMYLNYAVGFTEYVDQLKEQEKSLDDLEKFSMFGR